MHLKGFTFNKKNGKRSVKGVMHTKSNMHVWPGFKLSKSKFRIIKERLFYITLKRHGIGLLFVKQRNVFC